MSKPVIRQLTVEDAAELQAISVETFKDTFAAQNTTANMTAFLTSAYNLPKLTTELQRPGSRFYFIEAGGQVLGYLKLNVDPAQSEKMGPESLEIERIYIRPTEKHRGLGSQFLKFAFDLARSEDKTQIWLGVWEHNEPAKRFYEKWDFKRFSQHAFVMGTDRQTDFLMKRAL
ncbi:GNAT family N-acetyltransferase [Lactiplantibacillus sp. WILCCON 0030]|uniref:GNAT family N-acetyltransferase n=1 Tax=Lactiplantibacillus brownii TaxID=3069269 RepID=A0ABU1A8U8_9LACO|nr:GNAT family N-acetyltransferase [Lactiplantibacillus brownii]MDQ7937384.1 GNAT family N-acetyltransferase [Lactiplantibacillus brownii]